MLSTYTVPWVAVEHPEGWKAALEWIDSPEEKLSLAGWSTLGGIAAVREDKDLDLQAIEKLLDRVAKTIHQSPNQTRSAMNGFVIAIGSCVKPLAAKAQAGGERDRRATERLKKSERCRHLRAALVLAPGTCLSALG